MPQFPALFSHFPVAWRQLLPDSIVQEVLPPLAQKIQEAQAHNAVIYPPQPLWFNVLNRIIPEGVLVCVLGQDPYHGPGQAHGMSFSVPDGVALPPSLKNIYQELADDLGCEAPVSGNLTHWANQGVLLLNAVLTVEEGKAAAHQGWGWEKVTDALIAGLSRTQENIVFILWGGFAQKKAALIDSSKHCILQSAHPSPLSAYRGFFGSKPFSKANAYLKAKGLPEIRWA